MSSPNKVVIVTGAASGIGAAISLRFAQEHSILCIVDKNEEGLHKVGEKCQELTNKEVLVVRADVTKDEDVEKVVQSAVNKLGRIDVLVNCAGIFKPTNIKDSDVIENFDKLIAVNLRAVVVMTKKTLPALIESKGCVVNISSIASGMVMVDGLAYSITKIGVTSFTKSVAYELASLGVRVNCISPGGVRTNIVENSLIPGMTLKQYFDSIAAKTPMQKCVEAKDLAELAVYLASDKASSITGADYVIDGGLSLGSFAGILKVTSESF